MFHNPFDRFIRSRLKNHSAPVPADLWDKVELADKSDPFDHFFWTKLNNHIAEVNQQSWEKINPAANPDRYFDSFFQNQLADHAVKVSPNLWEKINPANHPTEYFDSFFSNHLTNQTAPVSKDLWERINPTANPDRYFDQHIKNKLSDYDTKVPTALWEKINPSLTPSAIKPFILSKQKRLTLTFVLVLLSSIILYFQQQDNIRLFVANPVITGSSTGTVLSEQTPEQKKGEVINLHKTTDNNPSDKESSIVPLIADTKKHTQLPVSGEYRKTEMAKINDKKITSKDAADLMQLKKDIGVNAETNQLSPVINNDSISDNFLYSTRRLFIPGNFISSSTNHSDQLYELKELNANARNHVKKFPNLVKCPAEKEPNREWYAEVYAAPEMAFKQVENINATSQYLQRKDSIESMQLSYSAGFRIVKPLSDRILLKTGLNYTQTNERFRYRLENQVRTTLVVTRRTIIRSPGDTVTVSDTSTLIQIGHRDTSIGNRYRSIDIPFTIGFQFGNEDLQFGINAGVIVNLSHWYRGVILDTATLAAVPVQKGSNILYKSNLGLGLYAGFSILKRLNEQTQLFFEPYFRYNLSGVTQPNASFKQKFSMGGLAIGLRYNLNNR